MECLLTLIYVLNLFYFKGVNRSDRHQIFSNSHLICFDGIYHFCTNVFQNIQQQIKDIYRSAYHSLAYCKCTMNFYRSPIWQIGITRRIPFDVNSSNFHWTLSISLYPSLFLSYKMAHTLKYSVVVLLAAAPQLILINLY